MRRVAVLVGLLLLTVALAVPARGDTGPVLETSPSTLDAALFCPPTFKHPAREPVLLVHGTFTNERENWDWNYASALPKQGFDVCAVRLPDRANGDIQLSSEYVVNAVRRINAATGRKVDVLGHSQGGLEPRWALKWWPDVQAAVDDDVMLATPNHGTTAADNAAIFGRCTPSCWQMMTTSHFVAALNAGDETPGAVSYTSIFGTTDELVQPATTAAVAGGSNINISQVCPVRPEEHASIAADAVAYAMVIDAFTHAGPANPARLDPATCRKAAMPGFNPAAFVALLQDDPAPPSGFPATTDAEPPLKPYVL
jgi:pimeloyl-ACP methyl ester carboxylesterase